MKKVIFLLNQFKYSNGVARAIIGLCNNLDPEKYDITIVPMYVLDKNLAKELRSDIKVKKAFGFYFKGFSRLANLIPHKILYKWLINGKYDIEVAFQCDIPTKIVGHSLNNKAVQVIWVHTYDPYPIEFGNVDLVVNVSKCNAERCEEEIEGNGNYTFCYNLVDDSIITKASNMAVDYKPIHKPFLVSVARHSPEKGYLRLIKIMKELSDEGYKFSLLLIGDGPEHEKIRQLIDELEMKDYITLVGAQTNPHKYTAKSDVFICSSFSEGYSTACTEAAILGIPIITTSVAGGKEIIEEAECGILTGLDDESLKDAIRKVLQNPKLIDEWKTIAKKTSNYFKLSNRKESANNLFDQLYCLSEERQKDGYE